MMNCSTLADNKLHRYALLPLLIATLLLSGCSANKTIAIKDVNVKISRPRVFAGTFKNALYKADMKLYSRPLSGLMFFKQADSSLRLVMLSELGLKYFDVEYVKGTHGGFTVHHVIGFLDRKPVLQSLETFFRLLAIDFTTASRDDTFELSPGTMVRVVRANGKNNRYEYNSNSGAVSKIIQSGFLKKKTTINLSGYDHLAPGKMNFKRSSFQFELSRVAKE